MQKELEQRLQPTGSKFPRCSATLNEVPEILGIDTENN